MSQCWRASCYCTGQKLAIFLKFLGSKDTEFSLSQLFDVSESSIISARRQVCKATLEEVVPLHIGWPNREEMADIASTIDMTGQHHFPGVVGFLDGSLLTYPHCKANHKSR